MIKETVLLLCIFGVCSAGITYNYVVKRENKQNAIESPSDDLEGAESANFGFEGFDRDEGYGGGGYGGGGYGGGGYGGGGYGGGGYGGQGYGGYGGGGYGGDYDGGYGGFGGGFGYGKK